MRNFTDKGLTFSNNLINGKVNATAYKTSLSSSVSITNNNSAFNSLSIDPPKSSNLSPAAATCSKVIPNALAVTTALAIISGLLPRLAANWPDILEASARAALKLIPTRSWFLAAVNPLTNDLYVSSDDLPVTIAKRCIWAASSACKPTCLVNLVWVRSWSALYS